jgi:hypothetical protein
VSAFARGSAFLVGEEFIPFFQKIVAVLIY